jgi:hypothetical protein
MPTKAVSDPELRRLLADTAVWTTPAVEPKLIDLGEPGSVITSFNDMMANVANMYGHLFRLRPTNLCAQEILLSSFPAEDAFPTSVVGRLGGKATAAEAKRALQHAKTGRAADDEGLIAEFLQQVCPDQWAMLIADTFNASFHLGQLTPGQRFGILKILYKKGDARDLRNWRPLAITSLMYKIVATMIQLRWKLVLPAVIAECQHGFVYGRVQYENILKVIDACEWADMAADAKHYREHPGDVPAGLDPSLLMGDIDGIEDDLGLYICDRDKAFDRVCHLWLVRALCAICGKNCEWRESLDDYLATDEYGVDSSQTEPDDGSDDDGTMPGLRCSSDADSDSDSDSDDDASPKRPTVSQNTATTRQPEKRWAEARDPARARRRAVGALKRARKARARDGHTRQLPVLNADGSRSALPDAVRWIVVLLNKHHRKALINGSKTDGWNLLCSVFQGCPIAPMLYAVACEFEGRLQLADPRVTGPTPPRPSDLLTDWLADIIAARFADDTQNLSACAGLQHMLDNNGMWCMATGGGTQETKQEMTLRGRA